MIDTNSAVLRLGIRVATPLALLVGTYLLFAGHNRPGGGFAAGLVFGAVITLRAAAGMQQVTHATRLIAGGTLIVVAVAVAPLFWGDVFLDQRVESFELPLFGKVKSGSALPFDIGVTAIVVGLIVSLLEGLALTSSSAPEPHLQDGPS